MGENSINKIKVSDTISLKPKPYFVLHCTLFENILMEDEQ